MTGMRRIEYINARIILSNRNGIPCFQRPASIVGANNPVHSGPRFRALSTSLQRLIGTTSKAGTKGIPFVDFKRVKVACGKGGDGAISFFGSAKMTGPPSGGNGGKGGDVWIRADKNITSLNGLLNRYIASNGANGRGKQMHGTNGADVEIVVPVGTVVREIDPEEYLKQRMKRAGISLELDPLTVMGKDSRLVEGEKDLDSTFDPSSLSDQHHKGVYASINDIASSSQFSANSDTGTSFDSDQAYIKLNDNIQEIAAPLTADSTPSHHSEDVFNKNSDEGITPPEPKGDDPNLVLIAKHFKFRNNYSPQPDRIRMLIERIPYMTSTPQAEVRLDLLKDGERHLLIRGGSGGFGNPHFASPTIRTPAICGRGEQGREKLLEFELKSIADAGLVGLPNAGKSTVLKAITNAHPKIAPYPFTTLNPYIGTIDYLDSFSITLADIPGLISGAHLNRGLGHRFLRHIERSAVLVYVVDLSVSPLADYQALVEELEKYKSGLPASKRSLLIGNKADLPNAKVGMEELLAGIKGTKDVVFIPVSAKHEKNISVVTQILRKMILEGAQSPYSLQDANEENEAI